MVELASMIAREPFTDRPDCVCPVIAAFLRGWNDRAAYADRQRLLPYARRIVGSRAADAVTRRRRQMCLESIGVDWGRGRGSIARALTGVAIRARIAALCGLTYAARPDEGPAELAARVLCSRRDIGGAFALLDSMLAAGAVAGARPGVAALNGDRRLSRDGEATVTVDVSGNGIGAAQRNARNGADGDGRPATGGRRSRRALPRGARPPR